MSKSRKDITKRELMNWWIYEKQSMLNSKGSIRDYERYIQRIKGIMRWCSMYIIIFEEENECR